MFYETCRGHFPLFFRTGRPARLFDRPVAVVTETKLSSHKPSEQSPPLFFVMGVSHLVAKPENLIDLLKSRGYRVERQ
jgi:hypothetical protein